MAVDQGLHALKVETHYRGDTLLNRPADATGCGSPGPGLTSLVPSRKSNGTASYTPSTGSLGSFNGSRRTAHVDYVIVRRLRNNQRRPPGAALNPG
jgi:hypothetical protein